MSTPVISFGGRPAGPKPYELEDTHGNFNVEWVSTPGKYYTIGLYDISTSPPYIHYLVVNRIGNDPGRVIVPYYRPNPPTGVHEYYFDIYEQPGFLEHQHIVGKQLQLAELKLEPKECLLPVKPWHLLQLI